MFTRKRPTDEFFKEDESLHRFVATALPEHVMDIIDLSMLVDPVNNADEPELDRGRARTRGNESQVKERVIEECVVSMMRIGVSCSLSSPGERMTMDVVVRKLHRIRDTFLRPVRPNRRRTPRRVSGHCVRVLELDLLAIIKESVSLRS
ncbi:hypothetical protein K2173_008439 [Erythroxylum novogranatense]|uniref:Uncharacterized protein n=1 Tax=Erythroxylum novogranatense TaxID=1862640 RepID=A0AAV8S542_9ROSI|nr:hypothetical protein K2173_008439 [Erythroxylum novogranatense]